MWHGNHFQGEKVKGQQLLVADVLNSQHTGTGATWRINTKILSYPNSSVTWRINTNILSTCRGVGILWRSPAQLVAVSIKNVVDMSSKKQSYRIGNSLLYPASAVPPWKGGKFPLFLRKIFNNDSRFLHVFGRSSGSVQ